MTIKRQNYEVGILGGEKRKRCCAKLNQELEIEGRASSQRQDSGEDDMDISEGDMDISDVDEVEPQNALYDKNAGAADLKLQFEMPNESLIKVIGICSFSTTRGKGHNIKYPGSEGTVKVVVKRKYRQYMNRQGGSNRALDAAK